jgi:hypothetical protein
VRNLLAFVAALGIVVAIFWLTRSKDDKPARPTPTVASGSAPPPEVDITKVRRLDKAARAQLRAQIAEAREKAAEAAAKTSSESSSSSSPPPALPDDTMTLSPSLQETLKPTIPIVAECYAGQPGLHEAVAQLVLTTDPELGTVIDTSEIKDENGEPLPPQVDTCMRDTIDSLALPPLSDKRGKVLLRYSFELD